MCHRADRALKALTASLMETVVFGVLSALKPCGVQGKHTGWENEHGTLLFPLLINLVPFCVNATLGSITLGCQLGKGGEKGEGTKNKLTSRTLT